MRLEHAWRKKSDVNVNFSILEGKTPDSAVKLENLVPSEIEAAVGKRF